MAKKSKKEPTWDEIGKAIGSKMDNGCGCEEKKTWFNKGPSCGGSGAIYCLGFLGSLYYFLSTAPDFWAALIGIVKSIFWPAVIAYGLLKFLGM